MANAERNDAGSGVLGLRGWVAFLVDWYVSGFVVGLTVLAFVLVADLLLPWGLVMLLTVGVAVALTVAQVWWLVFSPRSSPAGIGRRLLRATDTVSAWTAFTRRWRGPQPA